MDPELDRLDPELDQLDPELDQLDPEVDQWDPEVDQLDPEVDQLDPKGDQLDPEGAQLDLEASSPLVTQSLFKPNERASVGERLHPFTTSATNSFTFGYGYARSYAQNNKTAHSPQAHSSTRGEGCSAEVITHTRPKQAGERTAAALGLFLHAHGKIT